MLSVKNRREIEKVVELMRYIQIFFNLISKFYTTKNRYKALAAKKRAVDYTHKFENFLSAIIGMLATIGVLRAFLKAIT